MRYPVINNLFFDKIEQNQPVKATFVDLSDTFDTVNHQILLKNIYNYGIRGNNLELMKCYLIVRHQFVRLNKESSTLSKLFTAIPQGTILGPFFLSCT